MDRHVSEKETVQGVYKPIGTDEVLKGKGFNTQ